MNPYAVRSFMHSVLAAWVISFTSLSFAAINPEELKKGHPEHLKIEVLASHIDNREGKSRVSLAAKVLQVFHSESGLVAGNIILVTYLQDHVRTEKEHAEHRERVKKGYVGPQFFTYPPALEAGIVTEAHLARLVEAGASGHVFTPTASQYSFEPSYKIKQQ